jgi:hypothetical protein
MLFAHQGEDFDPAEELETMDSLGSAFRLCAKKKSGEKVLWRGKDRSPR